MATTKLPEGVPGWSTVTYYPEGYPIDPVTGHCDADPIGYAYVGNDDQTVSERFDTLAEMYEAREKAMNEEAPE